MSNPCAYRNCDNASWNITMFRFPVHDENRLSMWIRNSGNTHLSLLTSQELSRRYICAAHFLPSDICCGPLRTVLSRHAVPLHFHCAKVGDRPSARARADVDMQMDVLPSSEVSFVENSTPFCRSILQTSSTEQTQMQECASKASPSEVNVQKIKQEFPITDQDTYKIDNNASKVSPLEVYIDIEPVQNIKEEKVKDEPLSFKDCDKGQTTNIGNIKIEDTENVEASRLEDINSVIDNRLIVEDNDALSSSKLSRFNIPTLSCKTQTSLAERIKMRASASITLRNLLTSSNATVAKTETSSYKKIPRLSTTKQPQLRPVESWRSPSALPSSDVTLANTPTPIYIILSPTEQPHIDSTLNESSLNVLPSAEIPITKTPTHQPGLRQIPSSSEFFEPMNLRQIKQEFSRIDETSSIPAGESNIYKVSQQNIKIEKIKDEPASYKENVGDQTVDMYNLKSEGVDDIEEKLIDEEDDMCGEGREDIADKVDIEEINLNAIGATKDCQSSGVHHPISKSKRMEIITLHQENLSNREIARRLSVTRHTVQLWVRRYAESGHVDSRPHGRQSSTYTDTSRRHRDIVAAHIADPSKTIRSTASAEGVSTKTVRLHLRSAGLKCRKLSKKLILTDVDKRNRISFAKQFLEFDWYNNVVIFTAVKYFKSDKDGRKILWRRAGERFRNVVLSCSCSGHISLGYWGWMSSMGPGEIVELEGSYSSQDYLDILENVLMPTVRVAYPNEHIYVVHENCSVHREEIVRDWFNTKGNLTVIDWPFKCPDFNPVENLWRHMVLNWDASKVMSKADLRELIRSSWESLRGSDLCWEMVAGMGSRLLQVVDNKGGSIDPEIIWGVSGVPPLDPNPASFATIQTS